jgi:hypothetical protein
MFLQCEVIFLEKYPYNKNKVINFEILLADHLTKKFILNPAEGNSYKNSKPTPIGHGLILRTRSLKALPILSSK